MAPEKSRGKSLLSYLKAASYILMFFVSNFLGAAFLFYAVDVVKIDNESFSKTNAGILATIVVWMICDYQVNISLFVIVFLYSAAKIYNDSFSIHEFIDVALGIWIGWLVFKSTH